MRDVLLIISLIINVLVVAVVGIFGYQGYKSYKSMSSLGAPPVSATVTEVIDVNDGGYQAKFYVVDYAGNKVVVNEYNSSASTVKIGDSVKLQVMKNEFSGRKTVTYIIVP
jgi:uncharacterized protein (TIGR02588 family)